MNFYMNHGSRLDRADRPRPLRRDRPDRGAARHPLRVAARPARLVARATGCSTSTTRSTCTGRCSSTRPTSASRRSGSCTSTWRSASCRWPATSCAATRAASPAEMLPPALPDTPVTFEPNKDYVREVLAEQIDLRADGLDYVPVDELPSDHRYFRYQEIVNAGGAPSEQVIEENRAQKGRRVPRRDRRRAPRPRPPPRRHGLNRPTRSKEHTMPTLIPTADTGRPVRARRPDPRRPRPAPAAHREGGVPGRHRPQRTVRRRPAQRHDRPRALRRRPLPLGRRPHQQPGAEAALRALRAPDGRARRGARDAGRPPRRRPGLRQPLGPGHRAGRAEPASSRRSCWAARSTS